MPLFDEQSEIEDLNRRMWSYQILREVLHKTEPNMHILKALWGEKIALRAYNNISRLYQNKNFTPGIIRKHEPNVPKVLSKMRQMIDGDDDFGDIDEYFSRQTGCTGNIASLTRDIEKKVGENIYNKFDSYAPFIIKAAALVMSLQLERDTHNVSNLIHYFGVGGELYFLNETNNIPAIEDKHRQATKGYLHDFIEDLLPFFCDRRGLSYDIYRLDEFIEEVLPLYVPDEAMIKDLIKVTNVYAPIIKYAYNEFKKTDRNGLNFTQDKLKFFLNDYLDSDSRANSSLYSAHKKLLNCISDRDYGSLSGSKLVRAAKLDSYAMLYVQEIDGSNKLVKFADQDYNLMGAEGLSSKQMPDTLLKTWAWTSQVYGSGENLPYNNNFVMELLENALTRSEQFIISDMKQKVASNLYRTGWLRNIQKLSPIFYTDKKLNHNVDDI